MLTPVETVNPKQWAVQNGFDPLSVDLMDDFDLSMLIDGYSPDEIIELRKLYY
jgi:hypothetical protein